MLNEHNDDVIFYSASESEEDKSNLQNDSKSQNNQLNQSNISNTKSNYTSKSNKMTIKMSNQKVHQILLNSGSSGNINHNNTPKSEIHAIKQNKEFILDNNSLLLEEFAKKFPSSSSSTYATNLESNFGSGKEKLSKQKARNTINYKSASNTNFNFVNMYKNYEKDDKTSNKFNNEALNTENNVINYNYMHNFVKDIPKFVNIIPSPKKNLKEESIDFSYFKKHLHTISIKNKPENLLLRTDNHIKHIFEVQNFMADSSTIWVSSISPNGLYLATGGKSCVLKIWSFISLVDKDSLQEHEEKNILKRIKLIKESPFREYRVHTEDIIDICWSPNNENLLITASIDKSVILWDITQSNYIRKFDHPGIVSCVCFCPYNTEEDLFITACIDKFIRVWSPNKKNVIDYINIQEFIISVAFYPNSYNLIVGCHTGKCSIFEFKPKLKYSFSFDCKNKVGKFSDGRKVNAIEFVNNNQILLTTNDSRVRLVCSVDGKMIQKYKGLTNLEYPIRANYDEVNDLVISASDDGLVYIWKRINSEKDIKNGIFECFKPFEKDISLSSFFVPENIYFNYLSNFKQCSTNVFVKSAIVNISKKGQIQVLVNLMSVN